MKTKRGRMGRVLGAGLLVAGRVWADTAWTGAADQDWSNAGNWNNGLPLDASNNGSAIVNMAAGNYPIYTAGNQTDWDIFVGAGAGNSGRLDHRAGTLATGNNNWFFVGVGSDTAVGTLNIADTSSAGGGITGFAQGTGSLSAGKLWVGGAYWNNNGTGTVRINTSGTLTLSSTTDGAAASLIIGQGDSGTANATVYLENGTVNAAGEVWVGCNGYNGSGTATLNQSGGTLNSAAYVAIGRENNVLGTYNLSGGTVNAATVWGFSTVGSISTNARGVLNISGGTFNAANGSPLYIGERGIGTLTVSATGTLNVANTTEGVRLGVVAGSVGTANLDGGTVITAMISRGAGIGTNNFNGGTLRASASGANFMTGLTRANVRNGGAIIDSAGYDIAIAQALLHSDIAGDNATDGGLTKIGAGMLTLGGRSTFTGPVRIGAGTLYANCGNFATDAAFSYVTGITVSNGATLRCAANGLFGWDGSQTRPITVEAGGMLVADPDGDVNVGAITLAGGTLAGGPYIYWGSFNFKRAPGGKIVVTEDSAVTAANVGLGAGNYIDVAAGKTLAFSGTIDDLLNEGACSLVVSNGAGTVLLAGTNTYTGATAVYSGTLALSGSGSIASSSPILVAAGATVDVSAASFTLGNSQVLQGGGRVSGAVASAGPRSTIQPGLGIGTLTFSGDLNLGAGGSAAFEIGTNAASGNDQVAVGGNLTLNHNVTVHIAAAGGAAELDTSAAYELFSVAGTTVMDSLPYLIWDGTPPANSLHYSLRETNDNLVLRYTAQTVPVVAAALDVTHAMRNQEVTITATVAPGSGTVTNVVVNLAELDGPSEAVLALAGPNTYTNTFRVGRRAPLGTRTIPVMAMDDTPLTGAALTNLTLVAAEHVWDGGGTNNDWSTNPNWTGDAGPGSVGDGVRFAGATRLTPRMDWDYSVTGLVFDATAGGFTVGGTNTLSLDNGGVIAVSPGAGGDQAFNLPIALSAAEAARATITNGSAGLLTLGGDIAAHGVRGDGLLTVSGAGSTAIPGAITKPGAGNLALLKTGAGTLTLGNGSEWSGYAAVGNIPNNTGVPLCVREGGLLLNGGAHAVRGDIFVGGVEVDGGAGHNVRMEVNAGSVSASAWIAVARGNGTGSVSSDLVLNNAASVTANALTIGHNGGGTGGGGNKPRGSLTLNDSSSLTVTGVLSVAESDGSVVNLAVGESANLSVRGWTAVGMGLNSTGTVTVSGGTVTLAGIGISRGWPATGSLTISSGVVSCTEDPILGDWGTGRATLVVSGGTFNIGTVATKWMYMGYWDWVNSELNISSGAVKLWNNSSLKMARNGNSAGNAHAHVINQTGGELTFYGDGGITPGGTGNLDLQYWNETGSSSTYNLDGGVLTVPTIISSGTNGTRRFNFNGGTLRAATTGVTLLDLGANNARANVRNAGAIVDTDGNSVTIAQPLVHSDIGGDGATDGGLTKTGAGTLTLTAISTYSGATTVSNGTLRLAAGSDLNTNAVLRISGGRVSLDSGRNQVVKQLYLGTTLVPTGTWGSSASPAIYRYDAYFSGSGIVTVTEGARPTGGTLLLR